MRSQYMMQLESMLKDVDMHSDMSYSWHGDVRRVPWKRTMGSRALEDLIVADLSWTLYRGFFCRGFPPVQELGFGGNPIEESQFAILLSKQNAGHGGKDDRWHSEDCEPAHFATYNGLRVRMDGDLLRVSSSARSTYTLARPKDLPRFSPGYYIALGNYDLEDARSALRIYANVTAEGALLLMRTITTSLNDAAIPFRLKILTDVRYFSRADAAVLYLSKDDYMRVREHVPWRQFDSRHYLRGSVPALTKCIGRGLGLAESPSTGESFGLNRCRLIARGLAEARRRALTNTAEQQLAFLTHLLGDEGLSVESPYLNPESRDQYPPLLDSIQTHNTRQRSHRSRRMGHLDVALSIGRAITGDAFWDGERCSWIGAEERASGPASRWREFISLPSDLYSGTAGVSLFLADLYTATGDQRIAKAATGAIAQAFWLEEQKQPPAQTGLYTGSLGVALAGIYVGRGLGLTEYVQRGEALLERGWTDVLDTSNQEFDLLNGFAGAVVAHLVLAELTGAPRLLSRAEQIGDRLIMCAETDGAARWWTSARHEKQAPLAGFSHGAAGAGYGLVRLFAATGDQRFLDAAEGAFEYERRLYNGDEQNWPDLRWIPRRVVTARPPRSFVSYWCHGAPGIAVSRLKAFEQTGSEIFREEAVAALQNTRRTVEAHVSSGSGNFSLCHGLAGNAEILLEGGKVVPSELAHGRETVERIAALGIDLYGRDAASWPCGVGDRSTPGLLCGMAGIGHFYLRLHDSRFPSILFP